MHLESEAKQSEELEASEELALDIHILRCIVFQLLKREISFIKINMLEHQAPSQNQLKGSDRQSEVVELSMQSCAQIL